MGNFRLNLFLVPSPLLHPRQTTSYTAPYGRVNLQRKLNSLFGNYLITASILVISFKGDPHGFICLQVAALFALKMLNLPSIFLATAHLFQNSGISLFMASDGLLLDQATLAP